jgi:hypothetical protein
MDRSGLQITDRLFIPIGEIEISAVRSQGAAAERQQGCHRHSPAV